MLSTVRIVPFMLAALITQGLASAQATVPTRPPPAQAASEPPLSTESESLTRTRALVPSFTMTQSPHFVLLSDAPPESVQGIRDLLEATHDAFHESCRRLELQPGKLRHRLVAILFRDKADYLAFGKAHDGMAQAWAAGYYKPGPDRLVIYDAFSSPDYLKAMAKLAANERKLQSVASSDAKQKAMNQIRDQREDIQSDIGDDFRRTVAHEAAHQLFFHTGIQSPQVAYPLWIAEGLATVFEVEGPADTVVGFHEENAKRRAAKRAAAVANRLIPLRVLVVEDRFLSGEGQDASRSREEFYGQAYALTSWLARARPTEFRLYLDALKEGTHAVRSRRQPLFESIFGPVAAFERVWLRAEGRLWPDLHKTPAGAKLKNFEDSGPERQPAEPEVSEGVDAKATESPEATRPPADPAPPEPPASKPSAP